MIGIHLRKGSFSDRWVELCQHKGISFRVVDCLATNVVEQCDGLDALLWHWSHYNLAELLLARQVIASLEAKGLVIFPNVKTCWHFDDKVAQKVLLEAVEAPLSPTWVFTNKREALRWIEGATWPKVFKLRCGAGSRNVHLVRSQKEAKKLCRQAFGRGFHAVSGYFSDIAIQINNAKSEKQIWAKMARAPKNILNLLATRRRMHRERGYIYFQEFMSENEYDTRITIIGDRAFGFLRMNRPNDFRASGSGSIVYAPEKIDKRCVDIAFDIADRLGTQSLAFDFLFNHTKEPMIVEISYCYKSSAVFACGGWWNHQGAWHEGHICPEDAILEDVMECVARRRNR